MRLVTGLTEYAWSNGSWLPYRYQKSTYLANDNGTTKRRLLSIFWADRVQTPVMLLHNDGDDAVPWYQGVEFYLALRRLGKEVYLFDYNGEPHGLRKRPNQKDYTIRLQQYFDHYLKGAPAPAWMEKGVPYIERDRTELSTMGK